jgi:hypothetical protein
MGFSKEMFMDERIRLEIKKAEFEKIPTEYRILFNPIAVDVPSEEYLKDPKWNELKKDSTKAYKALKDHEFNLRHE